MAKTKVSIRIDLKNRKPDWSREDRSFGGDQQNRVHHGSRAIDEYVLS
jgi:hypothetical protein